jgi:hypothetical protein
VLVKHGKKKNSKISNILKVSFLIFLFSEQCRRKKVKCDGSSPYCNNCSTLGLQCHYKESTKKVRNKLYNYGGNCLKYFIFI